MRLLRAELAKLRTTSVGWVLGIITLVLWALTFFVNQDVARSSLSGQPPELIGAEAVEHAADLYTSGQFFGLLMVLLLGAIIVTSEFHHQTATTTFLLTPRRERVVLAKLGAAVVVGLGLWLVTTVANLVLSPIVLAGVDTLDGATLGPQLGAPAVWQAVGLNALAYAIWAILGVTAGIVIRSQIGATVGLSMLYVVGYLGAQALFLLLDFGDWFQQLQVLVPPLASQLMVGGAELPGDPPRWFGAAVLVVYAVIAGVVGTFLTKKRDIT